MLPALFSPGDRDQTQRMTPSLGPALMNYPLASASRSLAFQPLRARVPVALGIGRQLQMLMAHLQVAPTARALGTAQPGRGGQIVPRGRNTRVGRGVEMLEGCLSGEATN
jgi:hypothetical protein